MRTRSALVLLVAGVPAAVAARSPVAEAARPCRRGIANPPHRTSSECLALTCRDGQQ